MVNLNRVLALGVLVAFGGVLVGQLAGAGHAAPSTRGAPTLLPAAHANPVEVGFSDTLHSGETLSQLLARTHLAQAEAQALLDELRRYEDPRRLQAGSVVSYRKGFDDGEVRDVELHLDADRTLSFQRGGEGWTGSVEEVPVHADTVVLAGNVQSSLYDALVADSASPLPAAEREQVVDALADRILAYQVDFSRDLRTGDRFRILYERMVRPDGTARSGRVLSVQFRINNRDYEAYAFRTRDGAEAYYDREGESLRRAFLRAPLQYRRISSAFSDGRFHPILKKTRPHEGIDYATAAGTPVFAVGDGVVKRAGNAGTYGNLVELTHAHGYSTRYAHLRSIARCIRAGVRVKQGDVIGYVGMTGLATGPHLHFEFREHGKAVNPAGEKYITGDPIPARERQQFRVVVSEQLAALDGATARVLLADAASTGEAGAGD